MDGRGWCKPKVCWNNKSYDSAESSPNFDTICQMKHIRRRRRPKILKYTNSIPVAEGDRKFWRLTISCQKKSWTWNDLFHRCWAIFRFWGVSIFRFWSVRPAVWKNVGRRTSFESATTLTFPRTQSPNAKGISNRVCWLQRKFACRWQSYYRGLKWSM